MEVETPDKVKEEVLTFSLEVETPGKVEEEVAQTDGGGSHLKWCVGASCTVHQHVSFKSRIPEQELVQSSPQVVWFMDSP